MNGENGASFTGTNGTMRIDGKRLVFQENTGCLGVRSKGPERHLPIAKITSASVVSNAAGDFIHVLTQEWTGVVMLYFRKDQMEAANAFHNALLAAIDSA